MKKLVLLPVLFLMSLSLFARSTRIQLGTNNANHSVVDIYPGEVKQVPVQSTECKILVDQGTPLLQKGNPDLPQLAFSLQVPRGKTASLRILSADYTDYPNVAVAPSKGKLLRTVDPSTVPFTYGEVYTTDAFFPKEQAYLYSEYMLRDVKGQTVHIQPVQYNALSRTLRVYTHIRIAVDYVQSATETAGEDPQVIAEEFAQIYQNQFLNYGKTTRYSPLTEQGKMLVISPDKYLAEMAPFIEWKERKGIPVLVSKTDTLTGGVSETTIKNLVKYYFQTYQVAYVLLVGDHADIPAYTNTANVAGPSDMAYTYINGNDHYPDLIIARFSGETTDDIKTMVDRSVKYEKSPNASGSWMTTQIGVASNQGPGDDGQYDYEHIHDIVDSNKNQYNYLTNLELYDDPWPSGTLVGNDQLGDPDIAMFRDAINNGASLVNYAGHGGPDGIITTSFSSSDVPSLTNFGMLPFVFVVGCRPGSFTGSTCFAETLERAHTNSAPYGTISSFMSTIDQYWDAPMQCQDEFNALLRGARSSNLKSRLGAMAFNACMSMNDQYNTFADPKGGSDMTDCWTFFGDPTIALYNKNNGALSVTNEAHIKQNSTSFYVNCPVDGATVGLYYQGKYLAASTVYAGKAWFTFPALTALDTVYITATKQNYSPAFSKAIVVNWATGLNETTAQEGISLYPNPSAAQVQLRSLDGTPIREVVVTDALGQQVGRYVAHTGDMQLDVAKWACGQYFFTVSTDEKRYRVGFTRD